MEAEAAGAEAVAEAAGAEAVVAWPRCGDWWWWGGWHEWLCLSGSSLFQHTTAAAPLTELTHRFMRGGVGGGTNADAERAAATLATGLLCNARRSASR